VGTWKQSFRDLGEGCWTYDIDYPPPFLFVPSFSIHSDNQVVDMRNNASCSKLFLDVGPNRRAPKRQATSNNINNKGNKNAVVTAALPSESAIDVAFAQHLNRLARPGVSGDNLEITAFARKYGCDVKIYQRDFAYVVTGREGGGGGGVEGKRKSVLYIAYHISFV
jgi:OTU domain-containing protein 3